MVYATKLIDAGVDMKFVLTGEPEVGHIDMELLGRIVFAISEVTIERKVNIAPSKISVMVSILYKSGLKGLSNVQIVKKVRDIVSLASSPLFCLVLPSTLSALPYLALFPQPDFLRQIVCGIDQ